MTARAKRLLAIGLALVGFAAATVHRPFGGTEPAAERRILDPEASGYETGIEAARLDPEELARFKTEERFARYLAIRHGVPAGVRDAWCSAFVRGLHAAREHSQRGSQDGRDRGP